MNDLNTITPPTGIEFNPQTPYVLNLMREETDGMQKLLCESEAKLLSTGTDDASRFAMVSAAILELLDAHEGQDLLKISRRYRKIVHEFLINWQSEMSERADEDFSSLEVLSIMQSFVNLAECFFLNRNSDGSDQILISDLIRFLRSNMLATVEDSEFGGFDTMQNVLESDEPEQWDPSDDGTQLTPYWKAIRRLCIRGYTADAWKLLSYHSMYSSQYMQEKFVHEFDTIRQILEGAPLPGGTCVNHDTDLDTADERNSVESNIYNIIGASTSDQGDEVWRLWDKFMTLPAAESRWNEWRQSVEDILEESRYNNDMDTDSSMSDLFHEIPQLKSCIFQVLSGQAPINSFEHWAEGILTELLYKSPSMTSQNIAVRSDVYLKMYHNSEESSTRKFLFDTILDTMKFDAGAVIVALKAFASKQGSTEILSPLYHVLSALLCDLMYLSRSIIPTSADDNIHREMLVSAAEVCMNVLESSSNFIAAKVVTRLLLLPSAGLPSSKDLVPSERCATALHECISHYTPESDHAAFELLSLIDNDINHILQLGAELLSLHSLSRVLFCLFETESNICLSRATVYDQDDRPGGVIYWLLQGAFKECQATEVFEKLSNKTSLPDIHCSCLDKVASRCFVLSGDLARAVVTNILTSDEDKTNYLIGIDGLDDNQIEAGHVSKTKKMTGKLTSLQAAADEVTTAINEFESNLESQFGIQDASLSLLGTYANSSFELLVNMLKLVSAYIHDDYRSIAICLHECLVNHIHTSKISSNDGESDESKISLPLSPINMWMDLLFVSYHILENSVEVGENDFDGNEYVDAFDINGMHTILERFTWFTEISALPSSDPIDVLFKRSVQDSVSEASKVDWLNASERWITRMRFLMSKGLMNAFVQQNTKLRKREDTKSPNTMTIEDEVKSILSCPMFNI